METAVQQESWQKQWSMLVARAWADEELKGRLIEDPAGVLREHGIEIPLGTELRVVEDTPEIRHLVLPASPEGELVDEELVASVGRDSFSGFCGGCWRCGRCGCGCDASE